MRCSPIQSVVVWAGVELLSWWRRWRNMMVDSLLRVDSLLVHTLVLVDSLMSLQLVHSLLLIPWCLEGSLREDRERSG